jgi:hypothetical protein
MASASLSRSQSFVFFGDEGAVAPGARPEFPAQRRSRTPGDDGGRLPRFNEKFAGPNALVLLQLLSGGHRSWVGAGPGSKSFGQVEKELKDALAKGNLLLALELQEHSLSLRAQLWGAWSDPVHAGDRGYVRVAHLHTLVEQYNQAATQKFGLELSWSWDLLRKAWRIISDTGLVGHGKGTRKLRARTLANLAGLHLRRGKTNEALKCLNQALVLVERLIGVPTRKLGPNCVSQNSNFVFRFSARNLPNLDGDRGASDPFLRLARLGVKASHKWQESKNIALGREVGKTMHKTSVVMNELSPDFEEFRVDASALCGGDLKRPMYLSVYDWDKDMQHDLIGSVKATFNELAKLSREGKGVKLVHPVTQENAGTLHCREARISDEAVRAGAVYLAGTSCVLILPLTCCGCRNSN